MIARRHIRALALSLLAVGLVACDVKRPSNILSDSAMENVLYDYHISRSMGEKVPYTDDYKRVLYADYVFQKHGIDKAIFDSSMVWFTRHPDVLAKVYEKVNVRLKAERDAIDNLIAIRDNKPKESLAGDSVDVWAANRHRLLSGTPLDNLVTFKLMGDKNYEDRDTLRWQVGLRFLKNTHGTHRAMMTMQVAYTKNDSVVTAFREITRSGVQTISLFADTLGAIKEVRGFLYYPIPQHPEESLLLEHISLMRYHAKDSLPATVKEEAKKSSLSVSMLKQ